MSKSLTIGQRIAQKRQDAGLSQEELGKALGVGRSKIAQIETTGKRIDLDFLTKFVRLCDTSYSYILEGKDSGPSNWLGAAAGEVEQTEDGVLTPTAKEKKSQKGVHPVTVTVDHNLNEVITFVPIKAQAGYLVGYGDPEFIQHLPAFGFPGFNHGLFRAFEVQGYSMLQYEGAGLYPTDIVIAQYMEDARKMKDNRVYVIASDEGLLIKRCINRLESAGKLICNSDNANGDYPPIILEDYQIKEVWEFKGKFSRQIPKATRVFEEITDLQAKMAFMAEELKKTNQRVNMLLPGQQKD